jgi:hypothetical protein
MENLANGGRKLTPDEVNSLPAGTAYISPNGFYAVKQPPQATASPGATP